MNILFLYPNLYGFNTLPPSIGIFTALLRREGHSVALFDSTSYQHLSSVDSDKQKSDNLNARSFNDAILRKSVKNTNAFEDFKDKVYKFKPHLIAVSCTEDTFSVAIALLQSLGANRPKTVMGGVFSTFAPDVAYNNSFGAIDFILKGEGENSLLELCRRLESSQAVRDIEGLYGIIDGIVINNKLPTPVDISKNPLPDYSLFDDSRFYRPMQGKLRRMIPIQTIRGCPYTCGYCNSPSQMQSYKAEGFKFFRKQKIDLVKSEIEDAVSRWGADSLYFWADTFLAWHEDEFNDFCDMYSEFKLPFWIQTRPETVKEWKFKKLLDIGLLRVAFGVEHGNDEFRQRVLARRVSNDMIVNSLNMVTGLGIPISVNNIIGFPTETRELAFDTIELNRHFKSDGTNAYTFVPFHGTPLRELSEKLGLIEKGKITTSIVEATILNMPYFPKEEIEGIRRCFVLYVKMPKDRWRDIRRAENLTPEGDKIFKELKEECVDKYMHYGDYAKEDDVEKVNIAK